MFALRTPAWVPARAEVHANLLWLPDVCSMGTQVYAPRRQRNGCNLVNTAWRHSFPLPSLFEAPLKIGEHRYKAICPSHEERNASCVVNYHRRHGWRWHCFACNADGDALDVLTLRGMAVREALDILDPAPGTVPFAHGRVGERLGSTPAGALTAICDACRSEHATFEPREYRRSTSTALLEALLAGWEIAASVNACIGPACLESEPKP